MTLAERIDKTVKDYDPYGYADSECSVEYFEECLKKCPEAIIAGLLDHIDTMYEEIEELHKEARELNILLDDSNSM